MLVTICWFLLPDSIRNWLFTLHGALAFPYVLEMWMLGDTPATNVAGRDAVRAVAQLHDPAALRVWLRAKHLVLASFVGPTAALVAVVIGIVQQRYEAAAAVAITLLFLPLGVLSVAAWVGLWLPYHPQKLLWRWRHRSDWRAALLRWGVLVVLPFMVVPLIAIMLLIPSLIIWIIAHQGYPPHQMAPAGLWIGTAVSVAVSLIVFALGARRLPPRSPAAAATGCTDISATPSTADPGHAHGCHSVRRNHPPRVRRLASTAQNAVGWIAFTGSSRRFTNREDVLRMATLTAWAFDSVDGAEQASQRLQALQAQELIKIQDAAVVSWEPGKKKPKTRSSAT